LFANRRQQLLASELANILRVGPATFLKYGLRFAYNLKAQLLIGHHPHSKKLTRIK
jgi:hypothetical protein